MSKNKAEDAYAFFQEISSIYNHGFTLSGMLDGLYSDLGKQVRPYLKRGDQLSSALRRFEISPEITAILEVAETAGVMTSAVITITNYYRQRLCMQRHLRKIIAYPLFILGFALMIILVFVIFLVPYFQSMYQDLGIPITHSSPLSVYIYFILILGLTGLGLRYRNNIWIRVAQRLPLIRKCFVMQLFMILSLIAPVCQEYHTFLEKVARYLTFPEKIQQLLFYLKRGQLLSLACQKIGMVEEKYCHLLSHAEQVNALSAAIQTIAQETSTDYFSRLESLTLWLEPLLTIVVGLCIGSLAWIMLTPILHLSQCL
jgi:type II secretory pathway component PulF